jgi:hypothetical protein
MTRKMSLGICMTLILMALTLFPMTASAHAPKDVQLSYDIPTKTLSVTITHASFMPTSHYIKTVEIKEKGTVAILKEYQSQPDTQPFTYTYTLAAAEGDVIEVTATCSLFGSKTVSLKIAKT